LEKEMTADRREKSREGGFEREKELKETAGAKNLVPCGRYYMLSKVQYCDCTASQLIIVDMQEMCKALYNMKRRR
jgi:hypothetical protein